MYLGAEGAEFFSPLPSPFPGRGLIPRSPPSGKRPHCTTLSWLQASLRLPWPAKGCRRRWAQAAAAPQGDEVWNQTVLTIFVVIREDF